MKCALYLGGCAFVLLFNVFVFSAKAQDCEKQHHQLKHKVIPNALDQNKINALNDNGLYEGVHVYTANEEYSLSDTVNYIIGTYKNGVPVGDWKVHCKDGSYSIGAFTQGTESYTDATGAYVRKVQGLGDKTGIWRYYDKQGQLAKTLRYESNKNETKKTWTNKIYALDSKEKFVLVRYEFNSKRHIKNNNLENIFRRYVLKEYFIDGSLKAVSREGLLRSHSRGYYAGGRLRERSGRRLFGYVQREYFPNGRIEREVKSRYLLGLINTMTLKRFSEDGNLLKCRKGQYRTKISHYHFR